MQGLALAARARAPPKPSAPEGEREIMSAVGRCQDSIGAPSVVRMPAVSKAL
jgi:hypothetical protein